jgi:V-type H+-transporting ATPase subunit C
MLGWVGVFSRAHAAGTPGARRFVARRFTFDPSAQEVNKRKSQELKTQLARSKADFERWCSIHYGEAFIAWVHIKAIRAFVESVLRYGLPVRFAAMLVKPNKDKQDRVLAGLAKMYAYLDEDAGKDEDEGDFQPFYYDAFSPLSE